jgi:hypothetical protein
MTPDRDDLRAAVAAGIISEAQAASLTALLAKRAGARATLDPREEPFELFRGFNEIFIVVGLLILFGAWSALSGVMMFDRLGMAGGRGALAALVTMLGLVALARYFTLRRRMVAPSILIAGLFGLCALQLGLSTGWMAGMAFPGRFAFGAGIATLCLAGFYVVFRVPVTAALIALGVFATGGALLMTGGAGIPEPRDLFLLTAEGPFALATIVMGVATLAVAMRFDMADPHRIGRRSAAAFWLHVVAAPAIVNTVALTLFDIGSAGSQAALLLFLLVIAVFALIIDRRSFLVSGAGYVVALALVVFKDAAAGAILALGAGLVLLGAQWEGLRRRILDALPAFPGKDRLPPWSATVQKEDAR